MMLLVFFRNCSKHILLVQFGVTVEHVSRLGAPVPMYFLSRGQF